MTIRPDVPLGLAGRLTAASIRSPLTPLVLLISILVGLLATFTIPREEEPQILVPMVDIELVDPGMRAADVVEQVAKPLEEILLGTVGVEHVYVQARDHGALVTARFLVGTRPEEAAIRVSERLEANADRAPPGMPWPKVTVRGIDDVPIVVISLAPDEAVADRWTDVALRQLAERLQTEMRKVPDVGLSFLAGGREPALRITPDPAKLAAKGVALPALVGAVRARAMRFPAGGAFRAGDRAALVAGSSIRSAADLEALDLRAANGAFVRLDEVATVATGHAPDEARAWRMARGDDGRFSFAPAVEIALAKRTGANAVTVASAIEQRLDGLRGTLIPAGIHADIIRNYGATANHKANELLFHLALATLSIVLLVGFAVGWREALVTAVVIPTTILLTMFASKLMGYTINRVSLFALIFSIGILVDDAIVIVENIARHWAMDDDRSRIAAAIDGVAEVGNPTIIATLTVVAALLPMLFVSGMMGPYMAPIPVNASAAMIFSFFVAVVIAPFLMVRFARIAMLNGNAARHAAEEAHGGRLGRFYERLARPVIRGRRAAALFLLGVGAATIAAGAMFYLKAVSVKLLPFDNKSELQLVLDMPPGTSLEETGRTLIALARHVADLPEVTAIDIHAGRPAPFNFNGLVRHYFLRQGEHLGDLAIELAPPGNRRRSSHELAIAVRAAAGHVALPPEATLGVVETPPGPPVLATLLAEIHGPDEETRVQTAQQVERLFRNIDYIVDVHDSFGPPPPTVNLVPDRATLEQLQLSEQDVLQGIGAITGAEVAGFVPRGAGRAPLPITIAIDRASRTLNGALLATPVAFAPSPNGPVPVALGEAVRITTTPGSPMLFRHNGHAATMVMAELAGKREAPIYGMLAIDEAIRHFDWRGHGLVEPAIRLHGQPENEERPTLLWDGEWEVTWVTFRDMGGAFLIALVGIYVLVVAQFRDFRLPLLILTPVPLTLPGIVVGHMLFRAPFTATSMIGFIALAGIIVRNSILLVDFIEHGRKAGQPLRQALLLAGRIRFRPIVLTALAAMIGAATILADPIFQGLALSLLFGLASSTLLTVLVIPAIYVLFRDDGVSLADGR